MTPFPGGSVDIIVVPTAMEGIEERYRSYIATGRLRAYMDCLSHDGILWWFNMDIVRILDHLAPLEPVEDSRSFPRRLSFLREATVPAIRPDKMECLYREFIDSNDIEAAAAACGAGVAALWDHGKDFRSYDHWLEKIDRLLAHKDRLSSTCVASLLAFKALLELDTSITEAYETCREARAYAEKSDSLSLQVYLASFAIYPLVWMNRLSEAEPLLKDTEVVCDLPGVNPVAKASFQAASALYHLVAREPDRAESILNMTTSMSDLDKLPMTTYFLAHVHLLIALSWKGDKDGVETMARRLRSLVVPKKNYFHHAFLCYGLGISCLVTGEPHRALVYSREALERAGLSGSNIVSLMAALIKGQALADTGRYDEAREHLEGWLDRWQNNGFLLYAFSACMELSRIYYLMGMIEQARRFFEKAYGFVPEGERPTLPNRTPKFLKNIEDTLYPPEPYVELVTGPDTKPVQITTFGDLMIKAGKRTIYDRKWRGRQAGLLLKAIIVFGGTKVPHELLMDILWPDADGDMAENSLKVTLSRLRRTISHPDSSPMQWLLVSKRRVSLARPLCWVDSIAFRQTVERALKKEADTELVKKALDLYTEDFLAGDSTRTWIARHRELLKEYFVKATLLLSENYRHEGRAECAIPYLNQAIEKDPLNEELHALLMETYLHAGYPSKALKVYREAEERLQDGLGIPPGVQLKRLARMAGLEK